VDVRRRNPIRQNAQPEKYVEGFKKLSFVVTIAFHMDEPAILSDVLLPSTAPWRGSGGAFLSAAPVH